MSKPGKVLKGLCKKLGVRLTVKRGQKRVYKSVKVLKAQCANKKKNKKVKKKKKVKRKRRFGTQGALESRDTTKELFKILGVPDELDEKMLMLSHNTLPREIDQSIRQRPVLSTPFANSERIHRMRLMDQRVVAPFINLERTNQAYTYLGGADLRNVNLKGANLNGANLRRANLRGADLERANLSRANLSRANLTGANLFRATLRGANLIMVDLSGANLRGVNFQQEKLPGANLSGADLRGVNLTWADLRGVNLSGANLEGANLGHTNLQNSGVIMDTLTGRYLPSIKLRKTTLKKSNLRGANLLGVNLKGINLEGAIYDHNTQFPVRFNKRNPFHGLIDSESRFGKKKRRKVKKKKKSIK